MYVLGVCVYVCMYLHSAALPFYVEYSSIYVCTVHRIIWGMVLHRRNGNRNWNFLKRKWWVEYEGIAKIRLR